MRYLTLVIAISITAASCLGEGALPGEDIALIGDADPLQEPSLSLRISFAPRRSDLGWGSFDFAAHPEDHEFRVSLIVGERAPDPRWNHCRDARLTINEVGKAVAPSYAGVPMDGGVFDAVSLELSIEDVRAMSRSHDVRVNLCGDTIVMPPAELVGLSSFVRRFEKMATYEGPPPPAPPPSGSVHQKPRLRRNSSPYPA